MTGVDKGFKEADIGGQNHKVKLPSIKEREAEKQGALPPQVRFDFSIYAV